MSHVLDLAAETDRLLTFAEGSRHPDGGFAWLRDDGTPDLSRPRELWITTRMTHVFALGALLGRPGAAELVEHGLRALREDFRDARHGGWFAQVGGATDKRAYEHVFVVLAAASAGDEALLGEALEVLETRFWDERAGALVDVFNRDWTELEAYRGANANMHGVEAMLATGDPLWHERAVRVTQRLVRDNDPRLNEHFDAEWRPLPDYNRDDPAHPFRPFGATVGHWFEWARLAYTLDAGFEADARRLFAAGVRDGWDGERLRLHARLGRAAGGARPAAAGSCARRSPPPRCWARTRCSASGGSSPSACSSTATAAAGGWRSTRATGRRATSGTASRTSTTRCRRR